MGALCAGCAGALVVRSDSWLVAGAAVLLASLGVVGGRCRAVWLGAAFLLVGLWWGGSRLADLDRSALVAEIGSSALAGSR